LTKNSGQLTYIETAARANSRIVLLGPGRQIHSRISPRTEDRVDEHCGLEGHTAAAKRCYWLCCSFWWLRFAGL